MEARSADIIDTKAWDDSQNLHVHISEDIISEAWVYSSGGELKWQSDTNLEASQITVPTSNFDTGIYIIRIRTEGDEIITYKFFHR